MSVLSTSPTTLFGGTWVQLENRFLLGAGSSYSNGTTGGEATVSLTTSQMPEHNHSFSGTSGADSPDHSHYLSNFNTCGSEVKGYGLTNNGPGFTDRILVSTNGVNTIISGRTSIHTHFYSGNTTVTGSGTAHNNMPPYLTVFMWKRTA